MGNSFDASIHNSILGQSAPQNNSWANIAVDSQRSQIQSASASRPWMPGYESAAKTAPMPYQVPAESNNALWTPAPYRVSAESNNAPWAPMPYRIPTEAPRQPLTNDRSTPQEAPQANLTAVNPLEVLSTAEASLAQHGMTAQTKELYQKAIAAADSTFSAKDVQVLQTLTDVLSSGQKVDGTPLSASERFRGHQILDAELQSAQLGVQFRLIYSSMLQQRGQFASAQTVLKESIKAADQLPQDVFKKESQLLQKDLTNPSLTREQQALLGEMQKNYVGDKSLKTPGLAYLPTMTRLETAAFYLSGEARADRKTPNGVLKPEMALAMLDSAKTAYQQNYNADISKKGTNSSYDSLASMANMVLPENLKRLKSDAEGVWQNPVLDLAVGAAVFALASKFKLGALTETGLATAEGGLTVGGKVLAAGAMVGSASVGRHYGKELLSGTTESWTDSAIHGAAGLAEIGLVIGSRSALSNVMYRGANTESALLRVAEAKGTEGALTSGVLKDLYKSNSWMMPKSLSVLDSSTVIVKDGALVKPLDLGLNPAQSAELTEAALAGKASNPIVAGAKMVWNAPGNVFSTIGAVVNPKALDLGIATAKQIAARGRITSIVSGIAGGEGYQAITALDRPRDPSTGERISYGQSFANNMLSTDALMNGLFMGPFIKPGIMPKYIYSEGAGPIRSAVNSARNAWTYFTPAGALATSENNLTRAAMTAVPLTLANGDVLSGLVNKGLGKGPASDIQDLIDQEIGR